MAKQDIPIIGPLLNRIIGSRNDRFVKKYNQRATSINALEPKTRAMTDTQIRKAVLDFRARIDKGESANDVMVEAFAVAREAMDRAVGIRNVFDPKRNFDPSVLPAKVRALYDETKAKMDALEPAPADGQYLGCAEPVPGWRQVDIPVEIYNAVREIYTESRPPFRARPFEVQLIGAMVLYQGRISEMKTGEGKTIVAPLATYLAAVERQKVHVVTVNDYLVQRDRDWTFPFFWALGLTVGAIHPMHMQPEDQKRRMYQCDVVYGTTSEFGFDYLRDNMKRNEEQQVQKKDRKFAIVDEVDSTLIDEARTPLIISGSAHDDKPRYELADKLARHLVDKHAPWQAAEDRVDQAKKLIKGLEGDIRNARDKDKIPALQDRLKQAQLDLPKLEAAKKDYVQYYETHPERKSVHLSHDGIAEAQRVANIGSFYVGENMDLPHLLEQSLRAHAVYQRDKDYIVGPAENPNTGRTEPSIIIVDVSTGRPMVGRQWSDGLHQAIEAKEAVPVKQENQTVATVTIQNFFKMYKRLAGMTGTADTEAQEFYDIYKLDVVAIPTNKPVRRRDFDDLVFLTQKDKWDFIVDEIKNFHDVGRPVLVGTTSVEKSETLAAMLSRKHGIKHEVLNAKQHEREAHIVENAGQIGAVMIATNMAGRGTDIKLGPISREALIRHWQLRSIAPRELTADASDEQLRELCFRKLAPTELGVPKREIEGMPFADIEIRLLRYWATKHTWLTEREINAANAEALRSALDTHGRFLLHRLRWFTSIEDLGGLHVVGTERHESRRIDNQLRGRSGRQGDKGSSRFFISLEDDLMKLFGGETTMRILARLGMKEGDAIEHPILSKSVERAQRKVEELNFQRRKQILEYDEIMEHQRRTFYGLRQRVIEGRELRSLIFDYIGDATADSVADYLDPQYPTRCISEFASQNLSATIAARNLRGLDRQDLEEKLRTAAHSDARANVKMTLGEYLPQANAEYNLDVDTEGLLKWARDRFGIELSPDELKDVTPDQRQAIEDRLGDAACTQIDAIDLAGLDPFLAPQYGAEQLAGWAKNKFGIELKTAEIMQSLSEKGQPGVVSMVLSQTEKLYRQREVQYPVDYAMDMTMAMVRQNPAMAMGYLVNWANSRFNLGWTDQVMKTKPPQQVRTDLLKASEQFVDEGTLEKTVKDATACATDAALEAFFRERFKLDLPDSLRFKDGQERTDAIRSKVESILRSELIFFERTMMLEILDGLWKDHLYAMDQLRDGIGFRVFSQNDPRIEYKKEGSRLFNDMMTTVRDRVTDYVFKMRISPQLAPQGGPPAMPAGRNPYASAAPAARPVTNTGVSSAAASGSGDPYYKPPASPQA